MTLKELDKRRKADDVSKELKLKVGRPPSFLLSLSYQ